MYNGAVVASRNRSFWGLIITNGKRQATSVEVIRRSQIPLLEICGHRQPDVMHQVGRRGGRIEQGSSVTWLQTLKHLTGHSERRQEIAIGRVVDYGVNITSWRIVSRWGWIANKWRWSLCSEARGGRGCDCKLWIYIEMVCRYLPRRRRVILSGGAGWERGRRLI